MTQRKLNAMAFAKGLRLMMEGPTSAAEIAEVTGLTKLTVWLWLKELHAEGVVYVSGHEKDRLGRMNGKLWSVGLDQKDAKRVTKPRKQVRAESRARQRQAQLLGITA